MKIFAVLFPANKCNKVQFHNKKHVIWVKWKKKVNGEIRFWIAPILLYFINKVYVTSWVNPRCCNVPKIESTLFVSTNTVIGKQSQYKKTEPRMRLVPISKLPIGGLKLIEKQIFYPCPFLLLADLWFSYAKLEAK